MNTRFVIHEHFAVRAGLHYDLRLEHDNILKSWASRKIPVLVNQTLPKIILFEQPDHNLDWLTFEGNIKEGYGKGKVSIWDKGTYDLIKWDGKHIIVNFHGTKINGIYVMIPYEKLGLKKWLMFKKKE